MSPKAKQLLEEALQLPDDARAALAAHLIESLDAATDEGVEAAWADEIARRLRELDSGSVKTLSWPEARSRILEGGSTRDRS